MNFKSIEFFQYRCFMDGILTFGEKDEDDRSINLIIAENGGGKTELLFAFPWVLYDFDFSTLSTKEATPYSLNSEIYRKLLTSSNGCVDACWVEIKFFHDMNTYTLKKIETYDKVEGHPTIQSKVKKELSVKLESGVTNPPITDQKCIDKILNEMIPRKVLNGIIFDGERMQKLASSDERSVDGVKGVIFDVTNQEKIEYLLDVIKTVEDNINKDIAKAKRGTGSRKIDIFTNKIQSLECNITNNKRLFENAERELNVCKSTLDDISLQLKKYDEIKELESKRIEAEKNLKRILGEIEDSVDHFNIELNLSGFALVIDEILKDAQGIIESFDVPKGLNVQAVDSILKKGKCICGEELSHEKITTLCSLREFLPPDNVNSALLEQIDSLKNNKENSRVRLNQYRSHIKKLDLEKTKLDGEITFYRSQISLSKIGDSKELEAKRSELYSRKAELTTLINRLPDEINADTIEANSYRSDKDALIVKAEISEKLAVKWKFINKTKKATEQLRDDLQKMALQKINENLKKSYREITASSEIGRDVHLVHTIERPGIKYRVVNYYVESVLNYYHNANWEILCTKYGLDFNNLSDSQKEELAILENAVGKSTGQSKVVAIPFAKAILDYSCSKKEDEIQGEKMYPFLIDAPFGDLSGDNLRNSAKKLHSFSNQVILMISPDSYNMVKDYIEPYVRSTVKLTKAASKNESIIGVE
ncbi:MAG: hypothetical protein A4E23_00432 [Methanomethylovorans sp. PtaU1.Bin073]|nr:MAG: hypothetical protein A4E23_00432 [Methanomethylovorans sp. PtaU1.Bin073]